jgi:type IV secretory pathway VirB10-like protein
MRGTVAGDSHLRWPLLLALLALTGMACLAQEVSLGEFARQQRAARTSRPARVITNDDLAADVQPEPAPPAAAKKAEAAPEKANPATPAAKTAKPPGPVEAFQEKERSFRARYADQKREIERLQRLLLAAEHDYDYQTTVYWMDAGSRLRQNDTWVEKRTRYEKEIDETRKQLTAAQEKLENIREEARRAGLTENSLER